MSRPAAVVFLTLHSWDSPLTQGVPGLLFSRYSKLKSYSMRFRP